MSDEALLINPFEEKVTEVTYSKNEANYFLHVVDFHRETIAEVLARISPLDLVVVCAFIQAAIETQIPAAGPAFDEQRQFFDAIYPSILAGNEVLHPEDKVAEGNLIIVIPSPTPDTLGVCNTVEPPLLVAPGSRMVN